MKGRRRAQWLAASALAAGLLLASHGGARLWQQKSENAAIAALAAGRDVPVGDGAPALVLAARARFLIEKGRIDEARAIAEHMNTPDRATVRASVLYALGNEHLRQAVQIFMLVPLRQVRPLVNAAKAEYRQALQLDPDNWDCRYNFAIASGLIHEKEESKAMLGAQMSHDRAAWPDIPGAPNGMP
jgi:mxaK protein